MRTHTPHVLMLPLPLNGHINPMMELAKRLASANITVTFAYYSRPAQTSARTKILEHIAQFSGSSHLRVVVVPTGLSSEELHGFANLHILAEASQVMEKELGCLIEKAKAKEEPITCIVSDTLYGTWPQDVADKFGIPRADFCPLTATCYFLAYHLPLLIDRGFVHPRIFDREIICPKITDKETLITCLPDIFPLRVKDLPSHFLFEGPDPSGFLQNGIRGYRRAREARWVFIHTCYELERKVIDVLRGEQIAVKPIGPLIPHPYDKPEIPISVPRDDECMRWLDTQSMSSVLYVSFGTTGGWSREELEALALGIEDSEQSFLWAVRPDMLLGNSSQTTSEILPEGLAERTKNRSLMVPWTPQLSVLAHPSVGGFFTHCGWNSILESIYMGVPMLGVSDTADQTTNFSILTRQLKVGIGIERSEDTGKLEKAHVRKAIRALMEGEEGKEAKKKATELQQAVRRAALEEDGSSKQCLDSFIQDLWCLAKQ